jgi:nucleoside-diphosphate-sugar epimerase
MTIVTGANGKLGRAVAGRLVEKLPASEIGVTVRDPEKASALGLFAASRGGEFAAVDPTLERLLGRPPIALRETLATRLGAEERQGAHGVIPGLGVHLAKGRTVPSRGEPL